MESRQKVTVKNVIPSVSEKLNDNHHNMSLSNKMSPKKCLTCNEMKQESDFYARYATCKECIKAKQRDRNKVNAQKKPEKGNKECSECGEKKDNKEFRINRAQCRDCEREYGKKYSANNRHKRVEWVKQNPERMKELQATWYQKNKKKINKEFAKKYHENVRFNIDRKMRKRDENNIFTGKIENTGLRKFQWIEFLFSLDSNMTWENYGSYWHIDHVIPPKYFDIIDNEEERYLCYSWINLRPMSRTMNRQKGDYLYYHIIRNQICSLYTFSVKKEKQIELREIIKKYSKKIDILMKKFKSDMRDTL